MSTSTTPTAAPATRSRGKKPAAQPAPTVAGEALKATVFRENLKRGLAMALHAVAGKSSLPVLSNVLLETAGANRLKISATNLEIGIVVWVGAQIERPGAITLPAKLLTDVVGSLPNDTITLDMNVRTQSVELTCAQFEATIKGIAA